MEALRKTRRNLKPRVPTVSLELELDIDDETGGLDEYENLDKQKSSPRFNINKYFTQSFNNLHLRQGNRAPFNTEPIPKVRHRLNRAKHENKRVLTDVRVPEEDITHYIPCLYLEPKDLTGKVIIFFHGNGEDLMTGHYFLSYMLHHLNVHAHHLHTAPKLIFLDPHNRRGIPRLWHLPGNTIRNTN